MRPAGRVLCDAVMQPVANTVRMIERTAVRVRRAATCVIGVILGAAGARAARARPLFNGRFHTN